MSLRQYPTQARVPGAGSFALPRQYGTRPGLSSLPGSGQSTPSNLKNSGPQPASPIISRVPQRSASPSMAGSAPTNKLAAALSMTLPESRGSLRASSQRREPQQTVLPQRRAQSTDNMPKVSGNAEPSSSPRASGRELRNFREFDMEVDLLQRTCSSSISAMKDGPSFKLQDSVGLASGLTNSDVRLNDSFDSNQRDFAIAQNDTKDIHLAMSNLHQTVDEQHRRQSEQVSALMAQWEKRFGILETAVSSGLKLMTNTAVSMNERSSKFLRFGQTLEGAVDRVVRDGKVLSEVRQAIDDLRVDVDRLMQEVSDERSTRRKDLAELVSLTSSQTRDTASGSAGRSQLDAQAAWAVKDLRSEVGQLSREMSREATERRQMARTLHATALQTESQREQQDAMHKQILKLSRELLETQSEVRRVIGDSSSTPGSDGGGSGSGERSPDMNSESVFRSLGGLLSSSFTGSSGSTRTSGSTGSLSSDAASEVGNVTKLQGSPKGWGSSSSSRRRSPSLRGESKKRMPDTILEEEGVGGAFSHDDDILGT